MSPVMDAPETIVVDDARVACDGGGAFGHPRVFLHVGPKGVDCPYCGCRFVRRDSAGATAAPSAHIAAIAPKAPAGDTA